MRIPIELDFEAIHELSLELIGFCEGQDISPVEAAAGMMMTVGRLSSEKALEPDEEVEFLQYMSNVVQAYFATGSVN